MMNLLSILAGVVALVISVIGLVPLLGWLNWLALPIAAVGAGMGMLSSHTGGRNLNILVLILGSVRLWLGFGIL
ncbi:MAG: hypothetical protein ACKVOB_00560 [Sphingomonas sp.]